MANRRTAPNTTYNIKLDAKLQHNVAVIPLLRRSILTLILFLDEAHLVPTLLSLHDGLVRWIPTADRAANTSNQASKIQP
jgi:hypothetical protein